MGSLKKLKRLFSKERKDNHLADDWVDSIRVSTVYLYGIDHNTSGEGPPLFYETMVFGGALDGYERRYTTRLEAFNGHADTLMAVSEALYQKKAVGPWGEVDNGGPWRQAD